MQTNQTIAREAHRPAPKILLWFLRFSSFPDSSWIVCLCWGLTSQSTIFQSCRDGATTSWVMNQFFRGVKCLAQGHNTAAVGFEPPTSRSGIRHSTTEPPRSPLIVLEPIHDKTKMACAFSEDLDHPGHPPSLIRVFAVCMKKACVLSYPLTAQRRLWSDWADVQADLSLRWAHSHFVGFFLIVLVPVKNVSVEHFNFCFVTSSP